MDGACGKSIRKRPEPGIGRLAPLIALSALFTAVPYSAWCEESDDSAAEAMTLSAFSGRWSITSFLEIRRRGQAPSVSLLPPPASDFASARLSTTPSLGTAVPVNNLSLANRLTEIHADSLMTLWSGRSRSLVLGVQKGGYLGVRVAERSDEE